MNFLDSRKTCRCGATFAANDTIALVNHVASRDHAERLAALGIVDHNHSRRWIDAKGRPVESGHPGAREYLTVRCPACCRDAQSEFIHDSELPDELCRFVDCEDHGRFDAIDAYKHERERAEA